ncbi:MAG TPA: VWA domain-containing protein [Bryobacteraceae bacterium]|nr:VWA domain-containing protein [Bryobacteraceae bacterium]
MAWRDAIALSLVLCGVAAAQKLFVDSDSAELVRAVPELQGMQFDSRQDGLDGLLKDTGDNLRATLAKLVDIDGTEHIREMRFDASMAGRSRREDFRYLVQAAPDATPGQFTESRLDFASGAAAHPPASEFVLMGHFFKLVRYLLPQYRAESRFRYLGRATADGADLLLVAFAQRPESTQSLGHVSTEGGRALRFQGLVWIDPATHGIVRLRADLIERPKSLPLETLTTDMWLAPVNFPYIESTFSLPAKVTVHARTSDGQAVSVHRYSDYRVHGIDTEFDPELKQKVAGVSLLATPIAEDSWELLDRGVSLAQDNKPGEALPPLRASVQLNPGVAVARCYLAAALGATDDIAGEEAELRAAVKLAPDSGQVHEFLGALLFKRGAVPEATTEFREGVRLQPKDPAAHANLAEALEKTGDGKAATEEYRIASTLAPDNAGFKARYEQSKRTPSEPSAAAGETTIKVEVRQVLVPVVVRNKEGHTVTGLTQSDFTLFEDGVEQKISGFSVETAGVPSPPPPEAAAAAMPAATPAAVAPTKPPLRRTYLICIDALHTAFPSLVHIREALSKLFHSERAGDAQYVLISVGTSVQLLQSPTSDPALVLKVVDSKEFEKLFLSSRKSSVEAELRDFRRTLVEVRSICDDESRRRECEARRSSLPPEADQLAEQDRVATVAFLREFRGLVEQLRKGGGRRTIVLFSDGFELVPGQAGYELLSAYFPEIRGLTLRSVDRIPDMEPVLRLAANANIPIYTIDSRGLYTSAFFDPSNPGDVAQVAPAVMSAMDRSASSAGETLVEIAAATGGTAFRNSNNILGGLERAFADGREYYMLAYVPIRSDLDGKFRAISVRTRDAKWVVSAKRGYWAAGAPK